MNRCAEPEHRQEESDSLLNNVPTQSLQDGAAHTGRCLSSSILHKSEEDISTRKRQRTLNGPLSLPIVPRHHAASLQDIQPRHHIATLQDVQPRHHIATLQDVQPRHHTATLQDVQRTNEHDRSLSGRDAACLQAAGGYHWSARSGSRVTALYSELVRELEAQIAELHQILTSRDEAAEVQEWRIQELEKENQELRRHVQTLEEQNDALSRRGMCTIKEGDHLIGPDVVSDCNVSFLKNLTGFLEPNSESQPSPQASSTPLPLSESKHPSAESVASPIPPQTPESDHPNAPNEVTSTPSDGMLRVTGVTSGFQYWMKMDDGGENTIPESCVLWEEPLQETLPDGTPAWASPIESNGRPKLELVPASGVYITYQQLEDLSLIPPDKPKLMTRRLLDYFFSRETLARSSATGQRIAHNNTTMEKPLRLPDTVVTAIKAYVTRACGRGCNFNAVINSKCGTSRRAVKKMSIRIDWTEGGAKHCPKPICKSPAQRLPAANDKATITGAKTETLITDDVPQDS
ncbi:uncharacterized protein ACNLHF_020370 isoform 2-T3 [Anomaloglossus baeobatrachus]|uniref:uncharacterized protein LOC142311547 isoform X2 n=1 Tax=Anomaloglossus baeobatrachus TaxID=238106 RepID=UPI003F50016D